MMFCSEVFACVLVMVRNKKIIGHLFLLKTELGIWLLCIEGILSSQMSIVGRRQVKGIRLFGYFCKNKIKKIIKSKFGKFGVRDTPMFLIEPGTILLVSVQTKNRSDVDELG